MKKIYLLLCTAFMVNVVTAQNIGIGTNDPKTKLDINGGLSLREGPVLTLANGGASGGANDNIVLPDISTGVKAGFYRIAGPTATFSVFGIVPSPGADGQLVTLVNTTSNVMTIKNNASSVAGNSFKTLTNSDMVSVAGNSSVTIQYNKTESRWFVTGSQNYVVTTGSISTGDITTNNTAINMTNNTGRLVGSAAMTLDVATNGLNQKGIVPGPTGGNNNQVWGTDNTGNPAWQKVHNTMLDNAGITVANGSGISVSGSPVSLGGTVTVTNSAPDQTVVLNNGTGINTTGTYPNFTINNTGDLSNTNEAQTLAGSGTADINLTQASGAGGGTITLQGSGATTVNRSGNTFTISSTNSGGTVTNVTASNGLNSTGGTTPDIKLGGSLATNTDVALNSKNLSFSGTGNVSIGTNSPQRNLDVNGTLVSRAMTGSFTVGGTSSNYYPVIFRSVNPNSVVGGGWNSQAHFEVYRDDVHENSSWAGSFRLEVKAQPSDWGHRTATVEALRYDVGPGSPYNDPVGNVAGATFGGEIIVWLKGGATYHWRGLDPNTDNMLSDGNPGGSAKTGNNGETWSIISSQASPISTIKSGTYFNGLATVGGLAGSGSRVVVADANGTLSATTASSALAGDNLGNHSATTTLSMNGNSITGIAEAYIDNWIRHSDNDGTYWSATGHHIYVKDANDFYLRSGSTSNIGLAMANTNGTIYGYHYADASGTGILMNNRNWGLRVDNNGDAYTTRYHFANYFNSSDNTVTSGVSGIMVKAGDNYHRTADAASVRAFLGITAPTGDNLGNHVATTTLNMNGQAITSVQDAYNNGWWRNNNSAIGLYNQTTGNHFYAEGNYWNMAKAGGNNGLLFRDAYAGNILGYVYSDGTNFGLLSPGGSWRYRDDNSNTEAYGSTFYAPTSQIGLIYDRDNTGYYLDPASTSNVNAQTSNSLSTGIIDFRYAGGNSGQGANAYAVFQEGGGWGYPYPDLRIAYHTGISLGAYYNYRGIRFFDNYDMSNMVMAVNDVSTSGQNNVYVPYTMGIGQMTGYKLSVNGDIYTNGGWNRVTGNQGLYMESYGGGWYMQDGSWLRKYSTWNGVGILSQTNGLTAIRGDQMSCGAYGAEFYSCNYSNGPALWVGGYMYAQNYYYNSTRDIKKDIRKFASDDYTSALAFMDDLNLNYYRLKEEGGYEKTYVGFISEETPTVLTGPGKKGVSPAELSFYNTGAIKSLKTKVEDLETALAKKISDFGVETISTENKFVPFSNDFSSQLNGAQPVVTVTASVLGADMIVKEVSQTGFTVKVSKADPQGVSFNWIAMAKTNSGIAVASATKNDNFKQMLRAAENDTREIPKLSGKVSDVPEKGELITPEMGTKLAKEAEAKMAQDKINAKEAWKTDPLVNPANLKQDITSTKEHIAKMKIAEDAKRIYKEVPEDAPAKAGTLANPSPSKANAPK